MPGAGATGHLSCLPCRPSLFGHLFPAASAAVFGERASTAIVIISRIGLILLMFQIGMDFDPTAGSWARS
ncbi:MAG TPA: hypothetical protein VLV29_08440 [Steroidobacteraceae bacterium]|nr:hypothetical protein [Steroidobacteraceae bacterium]